MSEMMSTTDLQAFGPKSQPEDQELSPDFAYKPANPNEIVINWGSVVITPDSDTGPHTLSSTGGSTASFSGSSSQIFSIGAVQYAQFSNGADTFVNAAWDATGVVLTYMAFPLAVADRPAELPAVGVWMGTSSGGDRPHCRKGYKAYKPAKPQA